MTNKLLSGFVGVMLLGVGFMGCQSAPDPILSTAPSVLRLMPQESPKVLAVRLEEVAAIGDDEMADPEYILGRPSSVQTDSKGTIYIADQLSREIKVYSSEGVYLRSIGAKGEGPGEFESITCMGIGANDEIIVEDEQQRRFTRFSSAGEVLDTSPTDDNEILWPRQVQYLGNNDYLFLYKMPNVRPGGARVPSSDHLFHVYDHHFERKKTRFADKYVYGNMDHGFVDLIAQRHPGSMWVADESTVYYAPYLYAGTLFKYQQGDEGQWHQAVEYVNPTINPKAYQWFDPQPDPEAYPVRTRRIRSAGQEFPGLILNESIGLFQLKTGELVHFSLTRSDYDKEPPTPSFNVELFDPQQGLWGVGTVSGFDTSQPEIALDARTPFVVAWKDQHDRFYVLDKNNAVVRIYALRVEEAQQGA